MLIPQKLALAVVIPSPPQGVLTPIVVQLAERSLHQINLSADFVFLGRSSPQTRRSGCAQAPFLSVGTFQQFGSNRVSILQCLQNDIGPDIEYAGRFVQSVHNKG